MGEFKWKRTERRIAKDFGGRRHSSHEKGIPDVTAPPWAISVKERGQPPSYLWDWVRDIQSKADPSTLPLVVFCQPKSTDDLVIMSKRNFLAWFGTGETSRKERL